MTIEQKTIELQSVSPPLTRNQIIAELGKWQAEQSIQETEGVLVEKETPEVVENQEPVEEEVVENEEVIEEEGNQEVVADQQDAAVTTTPENASEEEDTELVSEDGSLESQKSEEESYEVIRKRFFDTVQKQKNETSRRKAIDTAVKDAYKDVNSDVEIVNSGEEVVDGDFTYKYVSEVDDEGNLDLQVFYKSKDDEEFINASERAKNSPKNVALQNQEAAILSQLGFLPSKIKEKANQQMQASGQAGVPPVQLTGEDMKKYVSQLSTVEKEALLAGKTEEEALAAYNKMLEEYDMAGVLKGAQAYSIEDAIRKKELEDERKKIGVRDVKRVAQINKELDELKKKYSISNILNTLSGQKYIDQELKRLAPDIKEQARKDAQLIPFNPETGIGYKDGNFILKGKEIIEEQPITTYGGQVGSFKRSLGFEESKKLNEQAELYRQAKVAYAKKNKVPLKEVTNKQVREDVVKLYEVKLTEEAKFKLYEDEAEKGAGIFYGFKGVDDIIGDDEKEKFANLSSAYEKYLDGKTQRIFLQSQQSLLQKDVAKKIALSKTYETQEEIDEVNSFLETISIEQAADFKIYNKTLDKIAERANTSEDAELFANLQSRNYGIITNLFSSLGTSILNLGQGVIEGGVRYGIVDAAMSTTPIGKAILFKNIYDQLTGKETETIGRKIADFTGERVDFITDFVNNEISIPKTWDDLEGGMDVARYLARATGEQIPIYVTLAYTGGYGLPLIGLSTAGSKFREMQKEIDLGVKDYSILQMYSAATINGISAAGTEYVTQGILGRLKVAYGANTGIKKGVKKAFSDMGKSLVNWAADQAEEIPSELLDTFINNGVDRYVLGDKSVNMFDGFKDTAISTLWTSGIVMRAPLIGQQIIAPFRSKQSFQVIGENTATINKLQEIIKDPSTSARAKQKAADQVNQLMVENMKALKVDIDRIDQFKPGERKLLMDLKAQQYEILRGIDATLDDGTLSDSQKELEIKLANTELNKLQTQSSQIIAPYIIAENKAKNEPIIQEAIEKVEQVTKKVLGEGINVIDDMNNLPEGIPKFVDAYVDPKTNQIYINKEWAATVGAVTAAEHELLHKIQKSLFDTNPQKAQELVEDFKNTLSNKELRLVQERIDANYRYEMNDDGSFVLDKDGNKQEKDPASYAEEYFNVFSDLVGKNQIGFTDNLGENLLRFLNKLKESIFKPAGFTNLEYKSGRDAYNFIKDYNKSIKEGKVSERAEALIKKGTLTTSDRTTRSITTRGQEFIDLSNEGVYNNESLVEIINSPSSNQTDRFAAMEAIVETNWPVISKGLKFNPTGNIPMDAVKTAVTEQMQGIFPGRNKELLAGFNPETAQVNTYLGSLMGQRQAEILERAKQIGGVTQEGASIDSDAARQIVDTTTKETPTKRARTPKTPTETVKYSDTIIEKAGVKDKAELETKITEATTESFKDVEVDRFGQTKDVPPAVAKIYGDMLGLNPETISDKTRTYQNYDEAGLNAAQRFLLANAASDYARLPKTKDETTTRGRGTFIPKNMKDALYTDGKLTGTLKDYMDLLRSKPTGPLYRDSKYAQLIRGLLNTHIRNRMFETLVPTTPQRLRGGAKFSITQANNQINEADLDLNAQQKKTFLNKVEKFVDKGYTLDEAIAIEAAQIGRSKGFAYENVIIRKLKELNIEGFKVSAQAGGNKVGIPDFAAKIFDANFDVEVKLEKAQYSDIGLVSRNQEIDFNNRVKKKNYTFTNRIQKELINPAKKAMKAYRKRAGELGADLKLYDKTGKLPSTIYTQLQAEGLQSDVTQTAEFNQDIISEIYENKVPPTSYIQLKNSGLFFMGKNPLGLPIPELTANVNVSLRISRGSRSIVDGVEMFTVNLRVLPDKLTNVPKSNYSLDSRSSMTALIKTEQVQLLKGKEQANTVINNPMLPGFISFSKTQGGNVVTDFLQQADEALNNARKLDPSIKKIRVFDFDDTLARSKSMVIVNMPDGSTKKIDATQFARDAQQLEAEGATFDFTEFKKVIDGKKGPLFNVAKKIADARGTDDLFILTARPADSANNIKTFLDGLNLNIPLNNITGLGDGTAAAKARWIIGKAAEGYNDFYFADDAIKNVKAVKQALSQIDVKSRVQQAKFSKTSTFNTVINDMIESSSGIESYKKFSAAKARTIGRDKGRFDFMTLASSAEDFKGLLYRLLGDGKQGEAQFEFLKNNLIDPYNRAEDAIVQAKISAANDFMALKEQFPGLPKTLETETGVGKFTYQHALRTYMWTQQDMSIPGLSKADARKLNKFITDDAQLQAFADQLISIQKGKPYPEPGKDWLGGNLTTDIIGGINKVNRAEYQQQWRENVEIIFSPENLNKMEAAYGTRWRKALENTLKRMKAGTNRLGYNDATSNILDWVNNSVGAVMFLNTRSALLQTISAVNFINWGDNNIIKAGQAFANQKQYWSDFLTLMNSDYLTQRRRGLKINVSESEIADAVKDSKNKVKAAIAYLLSKGFVFTRYADSFAIASGGATFYRNRIKKYLKEGMSQELAQEKAFDDFRDIAEESQQSSSPDKISMQQASAAGRIILNWANTPMQYVRIQKRALQDLIAGRGDAKVHISRIAYYGVMQNLIFNALQQALFAIGFGDDDEDDEKKKKAKDKKIARVANGMIDSQLKGLGIAGAAMAAAKNTIMKIYEESKQERPEYEAAAIEALSFSPAISSKYRKIVGGLKSFSWNRKEMKEKGFSLDNPAYLAGAQIITAVTNIPIDRVIKKANNIRGIMNEQSQMWQKVSMALGWSAYDVGLPYYGGWDKPVEPTPEELKKQEIQVMKRDTNTAAQTQMLLDLGLTKKEIKALRYEDARVKKIIELRKKKKDE